MDVIGESERHSWEKLYTTVMAGSAGFDFDFGTLDSSHNPVLTHMYESLCELTFIDRFT